MLLMQTLTTASRDGPHRARHAPDPTRYAPGPPALVRGVLACEARAYWVPRSARQAHAHRGSLTGDAVDGHHAPVGLDDRLDDVKA